jgi:hypothetical protein
VTIENAEGSTRPPSARRAISNCQLLMRAKIAVL